MAAFTAQHPLTSGSGKGIKSGMDTTSSTSSSTVTAPAATHSTGGVPVIPFDWQTPRALLSLLSLLIRAAAEVLTKRNKELLLELRSSAGKVQEKEAELERLTAKLARRDAKIAKYQDWYTPSPPPPLASSPLGNLPLSPNMHVAWRHRFPLCGSSLGMACVPQVSTAEEQRQCGRHCHHHHTREGE